jgi:hypothetical protein
MVRFLQFSPRTVPIRHVEKEKKAVQFTYFDIFRPASDDAWRLALQNMTETDPN